MKNYTILPEINEHINNSIMIKEHPLYEGVVYRYGHVSIDAPENDDENAVVNFNYEVFQNPDEVDVESTEFRNFIGEILIDIVVENMKENENNGDGSNNSVEPSE